MTLDGVSANLGCLLEGFGGVACALADLVVVLGVGLEVVE